MNVYLHEYNDWNQQIIIKEIEVKETPKCYMGNHTTIFKTSLDNVFPKYLFPMYSLKPCKKEYMEKVIKLINSDLECAKSRVVKIENKVERANQVLEWLNQERYYDQTTTL